ncbi:Phosphatidylinositol 4-phosphate 5-kinase 8 [Zea mays]|uniref:1-phosphatidylinositol-4-phosphate 5-kinase n=1 Tax=Zea mays TaxID=4577 RepID=A0A1D6NZT2_MAIZE|nr:Phosphatidylinositol 4-phosphate 5-kinase 8 [Zea mays]
MSEASPCMMCKTYPQQASTVCKNDFIIIKNRPCKVSFGSRGGSDPDAYAVVLKRKLDLYYATVGKSMVWNLRELFHIDATDYMMSICVDDNLKELSSPRKSGNIFYLSHDECFVTKTLRKTEMKVEEDGSIVKISHEEKRDDYMKFFDSLPG